MQSWIKLFVVFYIHVSKTIFNWKWVITNDNSDLLKNVSFRSRDRCALNKIYDSEIHAMWIVQFSLQIQLVHFWSSKQGIILKKCARSISVKKCVSEYFFLIWHYVFFFHKSHLHVNISEMKVKNLLFIGMFLLFELTMKIQGRRSVNYFMGVKFCSQKCEPPLVCVNGKCTHGILINNLDERYKILSWK